VFNVVPNHPILIFPPQLITLHSALDPREWNAGVYFALIAILSLVRLFAPWRSSPLAHFTEELCLVLPAGLFYFFVRGQGHADKEGAIYHGERIVALERRLGIFFEPRLQAAIIDHTWLVNAFNWVYVWAHWPVILPWFVWMWFRHHEHYAVYRNAILLSGGIGMICFALFPVAPPRLVPDLEMVDTVSLHSHAYRVLQPPTLTNLYAAMPSLHFGWDLLVGIAIARHAGHPLGRLFGMLLPVAMFSAIVLTANHYILDGVAGGMLALVALAISAYVTPRWAPWLIQPSHKRNGSLWRNAARASSFEHDK